MRYAKVVGIALAMTVMVWVLWAEAHQVAGGRREREAPGSYDFSSAAQGDTIWYSGFEPGDSLGINFDYNGSSSPDEWHVTKRVLHHSSSEWITAPQDSYFCSIGDDSTGYSDGNDVGYQIFIDLLNYSEAHLYYLGTMEAIDEGFAVYAKYPGGDWINLDPGGTQVWTGDWGRLWYPPDSLISLAGLLGHSGVLIEFWFISDSGTPMGFGMAIDEIVITGTPITSVEGEDTESSLPQDFALHPPYPNPFNAQTTIGYQVPEAEVEIGIYNVGGQLVRTLVQGSLSAGSYVQTWDGRDSGGREVESGIYFCWLQSEKVSLTRKLVLLR
ncbi:MAG: hypothetical protein AMJ92_10560 [candidate division Zixibacteria bacterium SM23_81]|nr:MAG: hypothetical protein AMJ92_10560 [candidate division Zixibacteria bacterium SM23_81]